MSNLPTQPHDPKPSLVRHSSNLHGDLVSLCLGEITTLGQAKDYSFRNSVRDWQIPVGSEATLIYKPASLEHLAEGMRICYHYSKSTPFSEEYLAFLNEEIDSNRQSYEEYSSELQTTAIEVIRAYEEARASSTVIQVDKNRNSLLIQLLLSATLTDRFSECSEMVNHILNGGKALYLVQLEVVEAQKGRGLAKQLINNFHQVASESGINKTYSMVDRNNQFKLAMAHLFHNSGYRGIDSNWDLERYTDPFTLYIRGLNHQRVSVQHEE
ncbi:MAG TPA: hypothetical protein VJA23_03010 [Candidatus Nanoarchaeia archaeon]|nr:hypothetical protein [Candidatus Nanoarchaeia archaeon]